MNKQPPVDLHPCPRCGTVRPKAAVPCWICLYPEEYYARQQKPNLSCLTKFILAIGYFFAAIIAIYVAMIVFFFVACLSTGGMHMHP